MITVAPQKDICPHGNTYPKNAAAIVNAIISQPDSHGPFRKKEEKKNPSKHMQEHNNKDQGSKVTMN